MDSKYFNLAVVSAKLLLVVGSSPALNNSEAVKKSLSRVRNRIDGAVVTLMIGDSALHSQAEQQLELVHTTLFKAFAFPNSTNLALTSSAPTVAPREARCKLLALLDGLSGTPTAPVPAVNDAKSEDIAHRLSAASGHKRDQLLRNFGSVVRNSAWLDMLLSLKIDLTKPVIVEMQSHLGQTYGSGQGRAAAVELAAKFLSAKPAKSRTKAANVQSPPVLSEITLVSVALDHTMLIQLPKTRELSLSHHDLSPRIADLLSAAALPVQIAPDMSATDVAQRKLDAFMAGLEKREAAIADAKKQARIAVEDAEQQKALEALRALGPLAEVLRKNPDLLKQL